MAEKWDYQFWAFWTEKAKCPKLIDTLFFQATMLSM